MSNNKTTDSDGYVVNYQPSSAVYVDFTSPSYSVSASGTEGYYDVKEKLGVDWAFIHLETAGKLDVVPLQHDDDGEILIPFQAGTTELKVRRIYYHHENTADKFYLFYNARK